MKLIKRDGKYLIQRGIFFKEYLDMSRSVSNRYFWWTDDMYVKQYCHAHSEIEALEQLRKYREDKKNKKSKTIKWFV